MKSLSQIHADEQALAARKRWRKVCKAIHAHAALMPWSPPFAGFAWIDSVDVAHRPIRTCSVCGARLPLGPANDDSDAVRVEMRAASLIACREDSAAKVVRGEPDPCVCFRDENRLAEPLESTARELAQMELEHVCPEGGLHVRVGGDIQCFNCLQELAPVSLAAAIASHDGGE